MSIFEWISACSFANLHRKFDNSRRLLSLSTSFIQFKHQMRLLIAPPTSPPNMLACCVLCVRDLISYKHQKLNNIFFCYKYFQHRMVHLMSEVILCAVCPSNFLLRQTISWSNFSLHVSVGLFFCSCIGCGPFIFSQWFLIYSHILCASIETEMSTIISCKVHRIELN